MVPQKIGPLILISQTLNIEEKKNKIFILISITALVGAIGGLIVVSLRKIITYSSIAHYG